MPAEGARHAWATKWLRALVDSWPSARNVEDGKEEREREREREGEDTLKMNP